MGMLEVPKKRSVYVENCVDEVATSVYGRDNRKPIHDAIAYALNAVVTTNAWCENIGLCVENGKLCVIFGN